MKRSTFITWDQLKVGLLILVALGILTLAVVKLVATPFSEVFYGDTPRPRVSIGFGVNWNSPFGPFRIDIAKALIKAPGDDSKLVTFNVGTSF